MTEDLGHFLYRSLAIDPLGDDELRDILNVARGRNAAYGLTGCLHFEDGMFFQWLEGDRPMVEVVATAIRADHRHHSVTVLSEGALEHRRFGDWQMRFSDRDQGSLLDWLANSDAVTVKSRAYAEAIARFLHTLPAS